MRDLGGYPTATGRAVRTGLVFRGDSPHRLTADDLAVLRALGNRSAIDLRGPDEVAHFGAGPIPFLVRHSLQAPLRRDPNPETPAARLPTGPGAPDLSALYRSYVTHSQPELAAIVSLVACEASLPVIVYCFAGKDRTGVVAALLLSLLDVPDEVIALDYARSGDLEVRQHFLALAGPELAAFAGGGSLDASSSMFEARAETIASFLSWFRCRVGDAASFLVEAGVAAGAVECCRDLLVEDVAASSDRR